LQENKLNISDYDQIIPARETPIFPEINIEIRRALKIKISADKQEKEFYTLSDTVGNALAESQTKLGEDDLIDPKISSPLKNNLKITVTRVEIREETVQKSIDFKTIAKEDDSLGWRIKKITTPGKKGTEEIKYKVVSHDGKEISRKILNRKTVQNPTDEIVVQGTYMKTGKANTGQGTWYAWKGGLFAASATLPRGSYAKVTNMENGKTVVVQINDYGPQGKGRIIDLDKVAFTKISNIGAGVIGVKVEQILN